MSPERLPEILMVDDMDSNLEVLASILSSEGWDLAFAISGDDALEQVGARLPDLVLLDINMPGMNGFEVCRRLKADERTRAVPVIFLTARTFVEDITRGFGLGAVDFVTKPFHREELLARVRTHLELSLARSTISAQNQQLARINQELENRVQRRTRDLSASNQRLREEIEEHQRTEERLRESEQRFRLLVEGVTDYAIFMLDLAGRISSWNAGAQRFKGYGAAEIIGEHLSRFHVPEDVEAGLAEHALDTARNQGHFEGQGWRLRKDGQRFWAHVVIDPIHDDGNELIGYAVITRDITQQRLAEQALNRTMEELMQSNASLEQFAYAASHDLKAPLRNIFSFVQLLEAQCDGQHSEEVARCLGFIRDNAQRMHALIEGVLEYSQVRTDQSGEAPVDLNSVVQHARENLAESIRNSEALIQVGDLPTLRGRDALLLQLFQNLIANAIKFQPGDHQPRVSIRAAASDDHWEVTVADNGIGIDTPHPERIFGIFHRLHRSVDYPGTGIGLAICKKAVEHHGGTIQVVSTPGQGSAFIIRLPQQPRR